MYELSRVRLYSIGPAGARYADTVLDLRGVGAPVPDPAPAQAELFDVGPARPEGPPRRPAPAGVLFLENGGGKSVLLKLIFSVMLPGHRNTLGGASSGVLRKFLLADDCGHVALEWQHTRTGETVVAGKVSEWRGHQVSADPRRFAEAWYSFRPGPGLALDSLPVSQHTLPDRDGAVPEGTSGARGRRRTMKGFRDALTEAGRVYPHLDVVWEETHERWTEHLGDLGLDPELFRYQREMNADEGEAAGLFAVKKDSDFTDLLLRAVTDTRDTDGLADLVHGFAAKLGHRAELTAERDFTAGSVELLERIVSAAAARDTAAAEHRRAEQHAHALAGSLAGRAAHERDRTAELAERAAEAAGAVEHAEGVRARSRRVCAELAHRHASLALAEAEKASGGLRRELADARSRLASWQAAELVLRHRAATDRAARVAAAIREAEKDAAPALAARQQAARALVAALQAAADGAETQADRDEERAFGLQAAGEEARAAGTAAATAAQRARSESDYLRQRLAEVDAELDRAAEAGWIDVPEEDGAADGPSAAPAAVLAAADAEQAAARAWEAARGAAEQAAARHRDAAAGTGRAELAAARAADARRAAETSHASVSETAADLAADPRTAELLGAPAPPGPGADAGETAPAVTPQTLDGSADALLELLDDAVATAERRLFDLRTAAADDSRILAALGDGGLLPPGPDVLAAVEHLGEHGVPALPGWRYLAQSVDPADHARLLTTRPELVDGVVVTDPDALDRARDVLAGAALLPRSAVAVGTAATLIGPGEGAAGELFVVPPNPAMHDEHAADGERSALRARSAEREDTIRTLAARLGRDRELAARIRAWREVCPPGRLAELAAARDAARTAAEEAEARREAARAAQDEAETARAAAEAARDRAQADAQQAGRRADALAGLAHRLRERGGWQRRIRELAGEAAEQDERQDACTDRARACDEDRRAAQRAADDARRTARTLRAERAEIAGVDDADTGGGPEPADPDGGSLPALREAYRAAAALYEKVGVGADLRAEQNHAESEERSARTELDRLPKKVRARAAAHLDGPDGADGPSRLAAAARAETLVATLESRVDTAGEQLGRLRGEAERLAPPAPAADDGTPPAHADLPDELIPRDPEHAQTLLRTAEAEHAAHTEAVDAARATHSGLVREHAAAERAAAAFDETAAALRDSLSTAGQQSADGADRGEPARHRGTIDEARSAAAEARRTVRARAADLAAAEHAVRDTGDALVRHAASPRFEQVRTPARQQIRELPAAALPEHAADWLAAYRPRLRVLTDELDQLERNRAAITHRLRGLVESALATLRSAQRLSRLPEGLGEWSGQEFLRIRFDDPDTADLTERLGDVVDEVTRAAVGKARGRRPDRRGEQPIRLDGMSLLLRGVHAALQPRGVEVEILKPDAVLRAERVPVGQMGDVFSGGQLLTAAIALYCTMAALRSNDRGRDRDRHAGTLFLDNPIGRANATYLLELQRAVADALGVQLIYTTGLFDTTALAEFPLVVRLRNDADLRAGLKYISVEEHLRPGLPQPREEQPGLGEITATRVFSKPTDAPEEAAAPPR